MKINKVQQNTRIAEADTVCGQLDRAYKENSLELDSNLGGVMYEMERKKTAFMETIQENDAESKLGDGDIIRDDKFRAVGYIIMGASYNPEVAIKESGIALSTIFDKYGMDTVKLSYNEESSNITNILGEFKTPEALAHIARIVGLSTAVSELDSSQSAFVQATTEWKIAKGDDGSKVSASELKKEILTLLNKKFIPYLNAMLMVNEDYYQSFALAVAEIIDDNNENVKRRSSKDES
jgi:hypothetical protein